MSHDASEGVQVMLTVAAKLVQSEVHRPSGVGSPI